MNEDTSSTARIIRWTVSLIVLAICAHMNWWLVLNGKPDNVLHQNAQFWSYVTIAAVLAGLGIGETISQLITIAKKPQ